MFPRVQQTLSLSVIAVLATVGSAGASPVEAPKENSPPAVFACPCETIDTPADTTPGSETTAGAVEESEPQAPSQAEIDAAAEHLAESWQKVLAFWNELVDRLIALFAPNSDEVAAVLTSDPASRLETTLRSEEFDSWYESQPRDEYGNPVITDEQLSAMEAEVRELIDLLRQGELSHEDRQRVEITILAKVALVEAHRFGGDVREDLLSLLTTALPDGRRIDDQEAEMLLGVMEGRVLLYETLPGHGYDAVH